MSWGDETFCTILPGDTTSATHNYAAPPLIPIRFKLYPLTPITRYWSLSSRNAHVHNVVPTLDDTTFGVPEHSPNGTVVGTLPVVNPANDDLTFTVLGGNEAGAFAINPTTGEITVTDSSLLDIATHPTFSLNVEVSDGEGGIDTANVTINVTRLANISGAVFVDVNHNGLFDANEPGIDGVTINLLNQNGDPVLDGGGDPITTLTSNGGLYLFEALQPGIYQVSEEQPTGVSDGGEQLGSLGGTIVANDRMQLTITGADAFDYAFAEFGQQLTSGDTAGVGFWHGKNGQALIAQGGTELAVWLTSNFGNIFGNTLVGMTGSQVASFYRDQVFKGHQQIGRDSQGRCPFYGRRTGDLLHKQHVGRPGGGQLRFQCHRYGHRHEYCQCRDERRRVQCGQRIGSHDHATALGHQQFDRSTEFELSAMPRFTTSDGNGVISSAESSLRSMAQDIFKSILDAGGV